MNKPNFIFKVFLFVLLSGAVTAFAQETRNKQIQADACYEIVLQLVLASNKASAKASLPPNLSNAVKKLKSLYAFSDYQLTTTFLQRTTDSVDYKSLLTEFNQITDKNYPAFSDWSLKGLRNIPNAQGRNVLQFDAFRFGMRIPIVRSGTGEGGNAQSSVVYDSTGLTTTRISVNENEPTVIGSLTTSKPDELLFLVLTVKPAE